MSSKPAAKKGRFGPTIKELQALLGRLDHATTQRKPLVYAECIPLLQELSGLIRPPLPTKAVKALVHETGWHLRSLAGLVPIHGSDAEAHCSWAQHSLSELEAWSVRHPGI